MATRDDDDDVDVDNNKPPPASRMAMILFARVAPLLLLRALSTRALFVSHAMMTSSVAVVHDADIDDVTSLVTALCARVDNPLEFLHVR